MIKEKLAIFGGEKARKIDFKGSASFDENEILSVMDVFKNNEFSRYAGGGAPDIEKVLKLKSIETFNYELPYWNYLGGYKVREFEKKFSEFFDIDYSIAVNSATSGLSTVMGAMDIGPGDEVITTCMSFTATATSILLFNSIPVFVDIERGSMCIDPEKIKKVITPKTKAILVVHLLGYPANMDEILKIAKENNLKVIEDCAQAPGVKYKNKYVGTIGDAGVFSFQETKNIMTGEGGMITTNNPEIAKKCRLIRNHGEFIMPNDSTNQELSNIIGCNFRMTEITAALGVCQIDKLKERNNHRNKNADYIRHNLMKYDFLEFYKSPEYTETVDHVLSMKYNSEKTGVERSLIINALQKEGIPVTGGYPRLLYENVMYYKKIGYGDKGCPFICDKYGKDIKYYKGMAPIAEKLIHEELIWFYHINYPNTIEDMKDTVKAFQKVFDNLEELKKINPDEIKFSYGR